MAKKPKISTHVICKEDFSSYGREMIYDVLAEEYKSITGYWPSELDLEIKLVIRKTK